MKTVTLQELEDEAVALFALAVGARPTRGMERSGQNMQVSKDVRPRRLTLRRRSRHTMAVMPTLPDTADLSRTREIRTYPRLRGSAARSSTSPERLAAAALRSAKRAELT